jgi:Protein of unknown function (DUF1552)
MNRLKRRNFIRAAGATLTIPFLECLQNKAQAASASGSLKRIIFYTFHNAWYDDVVFPTATNYMVGPEGVRYIPLSQLTGDISQLFTATKYGNLKSKMNLMRGFDILSQSEGGGGHRQLYSLGASDERSSNATKNTIDTVISNSSQFYPNLPFKKMMNAIPVSDGRSGNNFSYENGNLRSQLGGPTSIFTEYFSGSLPSVGGGTVALEDANLSRRLAMNSVLNKMTSLSKNSRLTASDKLKLSEHADYINKMLPNLAMPATNPMNVGASCTKPTLGGINELVSARTGVTERIRLMMDEVYMALNCQLTNMVSIQPYHADGTGELTTDGGASEIYHQLAGHHHDVPKYLPAKSWIFDQLLYLLNKMNSNVESNGRTMLDNSLVVVLSNDGCGIHSSWDMPVITFGSLGGLLKTGNYINYQRVDGPARVGSLDLVNGSDALGYRYEYNYNLGRPLGSFYNTLLNVLKIPHSGFGEYYDAVGNYKNFTTAAAKQQSLPIIT